MWIKIRLWGRLLYYTDYEGDSYLLFTHWSLFYYTDYEGDSYLLVTSWPWWYWKAGVYQKSFCCFLLYNCCMFVLIYMTPLFNGLLLSNVQMLRKLSKQLSSEDWTWNNLNTLCWAIGSISGSMMEEQVLWTSCFSLIDTDYY